MAIRMGYWDCPHCEHQRIEGPKRQCPSCGRPRDDEVSFYTDDDAPEIDDPALLQRAEAGADWHCPFCDTDNPADSSVCASCGGSDPNAKQRQERLILEPSTQPTPAAVAPRKRKGRWPLLLLLLGVAVALWFLFFRSSPQRVEVSQATWRKSLQVEQLKTEVHSSWLDEMPSGARELSRSTKTRTKKIQQGTKSVKVGKKDLGNGMFKDVYKKVPNYVEKAVDAIYVRYEIDRWVQGLSLKEQRSDGSEPPWPSFQPSPTSRVATRTSELLLTLKGESAKTYLYSIKIPSGPQGLSLLSRYPVGQSLTAQVTASGAVKSLESAKASR